ncbi:MAG TPA: SAM-dependent chlorinase/fluorinase [Bacteroidia bacterium]|nr:SAM-dependent chlorinase/fluorinase [Bacteroidia bacterium]
MSLITFTTDWGSNDFEAAAMKGFILKKNPATAFVDISNQLPSFDLMSAAYTLSRCLDSFPEQTVHYVGVEYRAESDTLVIAKILNQWLVCYNNGLLDMLDQKPDENEVWVLKTNQSVFPSRKLLRTAFVLDSMATNQTVLEFAFKTKEIKKQFVGLPITDKGLIKGVVIFTDHFGNAVTNISREHFDTIFGHNKFKIYASNHVINFVNDYYNDETSEDGNLIALFNDSNRLEISIKGASATQLLNLKLNDRVIVELDK